MEDGKEFNALIIIIFLSRKMGEVETYTSLAPVGAVSQEYRGLLVVSKVFDADFFRRLFSLFSSRLRAVEMDCNADFVAGKKQKCLQRHWVWLEKHGEFNFEIRAKY